MMGVGKAIAFGLFAMFPGALLSLIGYILIGRPETWQNTKSMLHLFANNFPRRKGE